MTTPGTLRRSRRLAAKEERPDNTAREISFDPEVAEAPHTSAAPAAEEPSVIVPATEEPSVIVPATEEPTTVAPDAEEPATAETTPAKQRADGHNCEPTPDASPAGKLLSSPATAFASSPVPPTPTGLGLSSLNPATPGAGHTHPPAAPQVTPSTGVPAGQDRSRGIASALSRAFGALRSASPLARPARGRGVRFMPTPGTHEAGARPHVPATPGPCAAGAEVGGGAPATPLESAPTPPPGTLPTAPIATPSPAGAGAFGSPMLPPEVSPLAATPQVGERSAGATPILAQLAGLSLATPAAAPAAQVEDNFEGEAGEMLSPPPPAIRDSASEAASDDVPFSSPAASLAAASPSPAQAPRSPTPYETVQPVTDSLTTAPSPRSVAGYVPVSTAAGAAPTPEPFALSAQAEERVATALDFGDERLGEQGTGGAASDEELQLEIEFHEAAESGVEDEDDVDDEEVEEPSGTQSEEEGEEERAMHDAVASPLAAPPSRALASPALVSPSPPLHDAESDEASDASSHLSDELEDEEALADSSADEDAPLAAEADAPAPAPAAPAARPRAGAPAGTLDARSLRELRKEVRARREALRGNDAGGRENEAPAAATPGGAAKVKAERVVARKVAEAELSATMSGLTLKGPGKLLGVATPAGKHTRFTEEGDELTVDGRLDIARGPDGLRGLPKPQGTHIRFDE